MAKQKSRERPPQRQHRPAWLVPDRVKLLRLTRGWDQMELAHRIDSTPSDVSLIERGKRDVRSGKLAAMATSFGVSADYLLGLTDDPTPYRRVSQ